MDGEALGVLAAELNGWAKHTTLLAKSATAQTQNRRGTPELVAATAAMQHAFNAATRQAAVVARLAAQVAQKQATPPQPKKKRPNKPAPSPEQAEWLSELSADKRARKATDKKKWTAWQSKMHEQDRKGGAAPKGGELTAAERQELWELFQDMDDDQSGELEAEEFANMAMKLGRVLSAREIADAMAEMDEDNSGSVSFQELADWWQANRNSKGRWVAMMKDRAQERKWAQETKRRIAEAEAAPAEVVVSPLAVEAFGVIFRHLQERKLKMSDLFALMDRDGGGEIDIMELEATLNWLRCPVEPDELAAVIDALDVDGGGTVDREEFFARVKAIGRQRRREAFGSGDRSIAPSGGRRGRPGSAASTFRFQSMVPDPRSTIPMHDLGTMSRSCFDVPLASTLPAYSRRGPEDLHLLGRSGAQVKSQQAL